MHFVIYSVLLFLLLTSAYAAENGSTCLTPNGENAVCIPVESCGAINHALTQLDQDAFNFAKKSVCGYLNNKPLVCCGGHALSKMDSNSHPTPVPIDNVALPDHTICGIQTRQTRVEGKNVAEIDEFPWLVVLKYTRSSGGFGGFRCTGTLINQRHVLTAAQCLEIPGFNLTAVRLGEWKFSTPTDCGLNTENEEICSEDVLDLPIKEKIPHPYYNKKSGNYDIAILRLAETVHYNDFVRPICLPNNDLPPPPPNTRMEIAGWGITESGTYSNIKLKLNVAMVGDAECDRVFPNFTQVNFNKACIRNADTKDICMKDSGEPLMKTYDKTDVTEEEQWYQEGIVYKGFGCEGKPTLNLYTRVSRYTTWIVNQLH